MKRTKKAAPLRLNGTHAAEVDVDALIQEERAKSPGFRKAFDAYQAEHRLGAQLHDLREKKGVSQKELAKRLKTSQAAVSRMESPKYVGHSIRKVLQYVEALGGRLEIRVKA
jgi:ribosome-binding protein aMBF1 (putative translation factor)